MQVADETVLCVGLEMLKWPFVSNKRERIYSSEKY